MILIMEKYRVIYSDAPLHAEPRDVSTNGFRPFFNYPNDPRVAEALDIWNHDLSGILCDNNGSQLFRFNFTNLVLVGMLAITQQENDKLRRATSAPL